MATAPIGYDGTVPWGDDGERLRAGMDVFGAEGERIGTIADIGRGYFLVQDGLFTIRNMYLPTSAVAQVDETGVYLTAAKREAEAMARTDLPAEGDAWYGAAPATVRVNEILLREQMLVIRTVATVTSEVHFRKGVTWERERVAATVRRESARVDDAASGRVHVEDGQGEMHDVTESASGGAGEGGIPWREGR